MYEDEMGQQQEHDEDSGIHLHCQQCYASMCNQHPNCPIIYCKNECGIKFHGCKTVEHNLICTRVTRPCINSIYGCPFKVDSMTMVSHLEVCPASVVHCGMNWNRYPLYSKIRESWIPFFEGNPVPVEGDLDTEMAAADQDSLSNSLRQRMRRGVHAKSETKNKRNVGQIDSQRINQLQNLLSPGSPGVPCKTGAHQKESGISVDINDRNNDSISVSKTGGNNTLEDQSHVHSDDEFVDSNDFISYDELEGAASIGAATVVTNYSLRDAYYDLPNKYSDYDKKHEYSKDAIITRDGKGGIIEVESTHEMPNVLSRSSSRVAEEKTESDQEKLLQKAAIYSKLKLNYRPLGLNVVLETMPKFQQQYPMYAFSCSKLFRRDQYKWHYQNIHADIHSGLNGWMMERCPLAQYGCPYVSFRFRPVSKHGSVYFNRKFKCFGVKFGEDEPHVSNQSRSICLLDLPVELLEEIVCYLDNLTLNCLAKTCHALKNVCYTMLDKRGIVVVSWEKRMYENGSYSWKEGQTVRFFSSSIAPVRQWRFTDAPPMAQHLTTCLFNDVNTRQECIELPSVTDDEVKLNPSRIKSMLNS